LAIGARVKRIGASRLSLAPALDRRSNARTAIYLEGNFQWGRWRLDAGIDNLLGSHADTFAFGNPFSISTTAQRTPVRPRTFKLGFRKSWP
jgi:iron complex outermembrane recepter protein